MAQASGVINVIRQVGGSFGVALLTTILSSRVIYHAQRYGESIQAYSPAFRSVLKNLGYFVSNQVGSLPALAERQSQMLLFGQLNREAFVQASLMISG